MDASASSTAPPPSQRRLWTGLLLAPLVWAAAGLLGWTVAAQACQDGVGDWGGLSEGGVRVLVGVIGFGALGATLAGMWLSGSAWRRSADEPGLADVQGRTSAAFLAAAGVLVSAAFAFGSLLFGLPALMVGVCEFTR